ncbi:MAG: formylglycine-generating enzyme family protein [Desulfobulbaceae bacterium]|nr:formylglycine-generating enzyme family protein [Desulfobulbaceae bacterium]
MEEIIKVAAGELITATKFNEMIEKIKKIDDMYIEINNINNMYIKINKNIETLEKKISMKFTLIPAGTFTMGSDKNDSSLPNEEKPAHTVTISKPFYLGTYPVTQHEWKAVMGMDPSSFEGNDLPVEQVSWDDVQVFIEELNDMEGEGTNKYRLPSEAEWEYAARADTETKYSFGDSSSNLGDYAWYYENSGNRTHPVGRKKPNPWGLYDMHGNVWEWVQDRWHGEYYDENRLVDDKRPDDGSAWESGDNAGRVRRGGGWFYDAGNCRSAFRRFKAPDFRHGHLGFRLLKEL